MQDSNLEVALHTFFNHENAFETVVWEIAAILSRPQCVKLDISSCNHGRPFSIIRVPIDIDIDTDIDIDIYIDIDTDTDTDIYIYIYALAVLINDE